MSETTNYKLYLTDDENEKFRNWREKMNGVEDSNMMKIDAALGEKADSSVYIRKELLSSEWEENKQVLNIEGITAESNGMISVTHDITEKQMEAVKDAELYVCAQGEGTLTIAAFGEVPDIDIPVDIILLG